MIAIRFQYGFWASAVWFDENWTPVRIHQQREVVWPLWPGDEIRLHERALIRAAENMMAFKPEFPRMTK